MPCAPSPPSHLLYSLVLELRPQQEALLAPTHGYHAYALLLQMLRWQDPALAQQLHDIQGPKPLTVSPLHGRMERRGAFVAVSPSEVYWLRLTILREELFARLLDALINLPNDRDLLLEAAAFRLHRVLTTPGETEWANFDSFDGLLARARPERRLRLAFHSPTAFRSGGQRNVALPMPGLVFGSLLARWNEFAPSPLSEDLRRQAEEGLLIARYRLETRMLDFGKYKEMGFEGECEYELQAAVAPAAAAQLATLADFAYYSGVGAKTAMGMGQARRLKDGRIVPDRAGRHAP